MATLRFVALEKALNRESRTIEIPFKKTSDYFGMNVFDDSKMQKYLSREAYDHVKEAIWEGHAIDRKIADQVATGMKAWAMEMGATHYTHWFHPLTEGTAEKHDAFIEFSEGGSIIESFSGQMLAQQEPDTSLLPSGGLRNTFEARGYSAWDPSSPAFIVGRTLSIPTIFVSYTGEALDHKTPLLRSLNALDKAAVDVCQYFDRTATKVFAQLGWEQEYYVVDEALYNSRLDLSITDRTLFGNNTSKNEHVEDHYFNSIPERVANMMHEIEYEAYKLGIPIKTRHNEVSPSQYEIAPLYEECNLAVDHNLLMMDLMRRIAAKHQFKIIYHEKPFKGINGSSKHINWSMTSDTGKHLHSPGKNPKTNMQFLTFLINTVKAVQDNQELLLASIASASNDLRIGKDNAPPSTISVFLGSQITEMLEEIEQKVSSKKMTPDEKTELKLDIGKFPTILLDNTDVNRTSPFAFTGNRFEFRAVGSSSNCATPMIALNTAVAEQLKTFHRKVENLIQKGVKKDEAIFQVLRSLIIETKKIRFNGNNYDEKWKAEAKKRGLVNYDSIPDAIAGYMNDKSVKLFTKQKIFTEHELKIRTMLRLESYIKKIDIESLTLEDIALNQIVAVAINYQSDLLDNVFKLKQVFDDRTYKHLANVRLDLIKEVSTHINEIKTKVSLMAKERQLANSLDDTIRKANKYAKNVLPFFDDIRVHIDCLEKIVDNSKWPLSKYNELLFTK